MFKVLKHLSCENIVYESKTNYKIYSFFRVRVNDVEIQSRTHLNEYFFHVTFIIQCAVENGDNILFTYENIFNRKKGMWQAFLVNKLHDLISRFSILIL